MLSRTRVTRHLTVLFLSIIALTLTTPAFASSFHKGAGTFTEFTIPTANSSPNDITLGPDGNFWFIESSNLASKVGRITPAGQITEFPLPTGQGAAISITTGPDGNLWFTTSTKVGKITPAGQITEFPVSGGAPEDITSGPDGNLWFTIQPGAIGRITPSGTITVFPSSRLLYPQGITTGPDGNLWFVELIGSDTGNINPRTGQITLFPFQSGLGNITRGPKGDPNLWFTDNAGTIGKIDPSTGQITQFPIPGQAQDITASQGFLWFTDSFTNAIGRMSLAGKVTEFPIPTANSNPQGITAGPHSKIWFTGFDANKIENMTTR